MSRAIKVRCTKQTYHAYLRKHFLVHPTYHVADPTSACHAGDVIKFTGPWPLSKSKNIRHVVTEIVSPWGKAIDERPKVMSEEAVRGILEGRRAERETKKGKGRRGGSGVKMVGKDENLEDGEKDSRIRGDEKKLNEQNERQEVEQAENEGIVKEEEQAPEGKKTKEEILGSAAS